MLIILDSTQIKTDHEDTCTNYAFLILADASHSVWGRITQGIKDDEVKDTS